MSFIIQAAALYLRINNIHNLFTICCAPLLPAQVLLTKFLQVTYVGTYLEDEAEEQDFCSHVPASDGVCLSSAERDHCALGYEAGRQTLHLPATTIPLL